MSSIHIEPGAVLLHYRLVEKIGAGGMGVVWKAVDTTLDREVAIKLLPAEFANDPERLVRFEREAKLLASLTHPNVAAVYGLHEAGGVRFLAMELVRGRPLSKAIAEGLGTARVVELGTEIADGLAAAHRRSVIHRDLKPDNIMIDGEGHPKILDFGLAKVSRQVVADAATVARDEPTVRGETPATTRKGMILGTVAYMSPEQAQGLSVDSRSDVFSFGIILYEMITGRRPFSGDNPVSILSSILRDEPPSFAKVAPAAPEHLDRIVHRCLEKKPEARYADGSEVREAMLALRTELSSGSRAAFSSPRLRRRWIAAAGALVVVLALLGGWMWKRQSERRWVRNEGLPQLAAVADRVQVLEEGRESWDAFLLARRIDAIAPNDPLVQRLRPKFVRKVTITSDPPGATVSARYYDEPDGAPVVMGTTPLEEVDFPRGFARLRIEREGKEPVDDVIWNFSLGGSTFAYRLDDRGKLPPEMTRVPAGSFELYLPGLDHLKPEPMTAFLMDRHEVTNREFKRFVDAGGYANARHWKHPFVDAGRTLTRDEAMARMVDRTGRSGPATWEVGTYPKGEDEHPVGGVSWYEAAAYADWAGKSLPTLFHWNRAAFTVGSSRIVPMSNLGGQGTRPVGSSKAMNRFGTVDLAGNVREWCLNESREGTRFILGGGWNDPDYAFTDAYAQPVFDRSPTNGFRCIRPVEAEPNRAALERPIDIPTRDFFAEKPVPDDVFAQYVRQFAYDRTPLDAKIEEEKQAADGTRQKITFNAAYGGERMMAYLFLPARGKPPYQVVVVFPGSGSISVRSSASLELGRIDFVQRTGRAVIWPIYKGTYERGGALQSDYPDETAAYKDNVIMWAKDLGRSLDYVQTRPDLDASRIAYYGISWGGAMGSILPAIEPRIKANVLYVAGLNFQRALPEVDQINYVTRVKQPTLVLNGELDFFFPMETSQRPLFELLGAPPEHKKRMIFPGGHSVPKTEMIRESLAWLDRYLGPVR